MKHWTKYGLFTIIFLLLTWFLSDELSCFFTLEAYCLLNLSIRYILFMVLMMIYDVWIKKIIFKRKNNNNK